MDSKVEFLFLNEEDMIKAGVLDADRAVDTVGEVITLLSEGDYLMGGRAHNDHGVQLIFPEKSDIPNFPLADSADRRFMAMPAYLGGRFHMCGEKWYGSNGNNRSIGLPRSILMMMLNDVETGKPLAYMSGNLLSSMRTGAMPGLAAKLLARDDSKVLTLVGPGVICRSSLRAIMSQRFDIDTIKIKGSSPTSANAIKMKEYIEENYPQVKNIVLCRDMEEALKDADVEADSNALTDSDTEAEAETDCDSEIDALSDADSELDTDCDSDTEALSDADSELDTDCDSDTDALTDADSELDTDCDSDTDALSDADSEFETDCDSDTDALSDTDSELETDCDPETDVLNDTDSLNDAELDVESDSLAEMKLEAEFEIDSTVEMIAEIEALKA